MQTTIAICKQYFVWQRLHHIKWDFATIFLSFLLLLLLLHSYKESESTNSINLYGMQFGEETEKRLCLINWNSVCGAYISAVTLCVCVCVCFKPIEENFKRERKAIGVSSSTKMCARPAWWGICEWANSSYISSNLLIAIIRFNNYIRLLQQQQQQRIFHSFSFLFS
jgi:hypothetical protein